MSPSDEYKAFRFGRFDTTNPLRSRPCGCAVDSIREIPWNLKCWLIARWHHRPYWDWDGFNDRSDVP